MKCDYFQNNCLDFLDGNLDFGLNYDMMEHADNCQACASHLEYQELLKSTLTNLPVPDPSNGFYDRVFESLESEKPVRQTKGFFAGFGTAIAAGLAGWLIFFPAQTPDMPLQTVNSISVAQNSINHVRLAFEAPEHYQRVTLTLNLPEGTELNGFPGQNEISWETSLKAGNNVLTLPVIARSSRGGILSAKISGIKGTKTIRLKMNVTGNQPLPVEI